MIRVGGTTDCGRRIWGNRRAASALSVVLLGSAIGLPAVADAATARAGQILLQEDEVIYDSAGSKVTARGHVEITDEGRTLFVGNDGQHKVHVTCASGELLFDGNPSIDIPPGAGAPSFLRLTAGSNYVQVPTLNRAMRRFKRRPI